MRISIWNKLIIFIALLCIPTTGFSQELTSSTKKVSQRKKSKISARQHINQLHSGALLVRLHTRSNAIGALRKIGNEKAANKIELKQAALNKKIANAFTSKFNFCPTYFFYSNHSENILSKRFDDVVFLNSDLQADSSIKITQPSFLIAEFGNMEQDTAAYFDGYYADFNNPYNEKYYSGLNAGFSALVLKNDRFVQLRRPFPYYAKTHVLMIFKRSPYKVVRRLNRKLNRYYDIDI